MLRNQRFFLVLLGACGESYFLWFRWWWPNVSSWFPSKCSNKYFIFRKWPMSRDGGWRSIVVSCGSQFVLCRVLVILLVSELFCLRVVATLCFMWWLWLALLGVVLFLFQSLLSRNGWTWHLYLFWMPAHFTSNLPLLLAIFGVWIWMGTILMFLTTYICTSRCIF